EKEAAPRRRSALQERWDGAQRTAAGGLEQDDVGAQPGQQPARERARLIGEIEDAQSAQGAGGHRVTKRSRTASSVSCETLVTRSLSCASVAELLGPTSIRIENSEKSRRRFSRLQRSSQSGTNW